MGCVLARDAFIRSGDRRGHARTAPVAIGDAAGGLLQCDAILFQPGLWPQYWPCSSRAAPRPSRRARRRPASLGPVWVAQNIAGAPVTRDTQITLQLGADGRASGRAGCNDYTGPYTLSGDALSFGLMAATKMACAPAVMDHEQRYFDTLAKVKRYAVGTMGRWC